MMAVNIDTATPIASVSAKPWMMLAPNVAPNQYRIAAGDQRRDVRVADRRPGAVEAGLDRARPATRPARSSSFMRSKIRMLASTAMPIERMKPAMPASVSVTGISLKSAKVIAA